jgi:hypothetical protein
LRHADGGGATEELRAEERKREPPNLAEEAFGVRATARWWETFVKVARVLDPGR